jgi:hypothetical protein
MSKPRGDDPIHLTQAEANRLLAMKKHRTGSESYEFPFGGKRVKIPLVSEDRRHEFELDVHSKRIDLKKYTFGTRTRRVITLVRVDLRSGGRHINPDHTVVVGTHIHRYREGYGDKCAAPLPPELGNPNSAFDVFQRFMDYCKIVTKPIIVKSLFTELTNES